MKSVPMAANQQILHIVFSWRTQTVFNEKEEESLEVAFEQFVRVHRTKASQSTVPDPG